MPDKSHRPKVPVFATEAEEAQWWDEHQEMVTDELIKAMEDGTVRRRPPASIHGNETIEVKLSPDMATKIQRLAAASGMNEEAYVGRLLREALDSR